MSNPYFTFKQFTIWHNRCAMKVGTDGVLLGTWANLTEANNILDIGTGTGLIALIAAQRNPKAQITGIDIDYSATIQATENIQNSPWKERIHIVQEDIKKFHPTTLFDSILCNPPYFRNSLKCPDLQRSMARHTDNLSPEELLKSVQTLITDSGEFSIIFPNNDYKLLESLAFIHSLYTIRRTFVHTTVGSTPKRVLLSFKKKNSPTIETHLTIGCNKDIYSEEFKTLVKDFYL